MKPSAVSREPNVVETHARPLTRAGRNLDSKQYGGVMKMNSRPRLSLTLAAICLVAGVARSQYLEAQIPVGESPQQVFWNPTSNKVYVSNEQAGTVTVIDGATNQVRATIRVADYPFEICHNSVMNKIYVVSGESNRLNVIDGVGDTLITKVSVSGYPCRMAFNATMNKLYVACPDDGRVAVVDGASNDVTNTVAVRYSAALLWVPTKNRVLCYTDMDEDTVKAIDCTTDEVVARLPMPTHGDWLGGWCYNPCNDMAYIDGRYEIYALTSSGDSVVAVIPKVTDQWCKFALVSSLNRLYELENGWMIAIDGVTNTISCSLFVGGGELVCDTIKLKAYTNAGGARVVDLRTNNIIESIPFGTTTSSTCWNSVNSRVYVSDYRANCVWVVRDTSAGIVESDLATICHRGASARIISGTLSWTGGRPADLMDLSGRVIAVLRPGTNDLSRLSPGVYVTMEQGSTEHTKVVKLR